MPEKTVYCTKDDVQRLIKRVQFSDVTKVTLSDIDYYIDSICGIIDGELRKLGITPPITQAVSPISVGILKTLAAFGSASLAESSAWGAAGNKGESNYAKVLQDKFDKLLESIQMNPSMLSDVVSASIHHMKSDTEDMNEDGVNEGNEIFTKKHITDFKEDHKLLSPSVKDGSADTITGEIDRTRV